MNLLEKSNNDENIIYIKKWKRSNKYLQIKLKKILKEDNITSWKFMKTIPNNQILCFILNKQRNILTFIHIYISKKKELQFSFSYTPILERRKGYNKKLRLHIIKNYRRKGIKKFTSIPFEGANSENLLIKIGFKKEEGRYIYNLKN